MIACGSGLNPFSERRRRSCPGLGICCWTIPIAVPKWAGKAHFGLDGVICYQEARCSDRTTSIFHTCHCLGSFSFSLHDNQIIVCTPYWAGRLLDRLTAHPGQEQCQEPLDTVQKWAKSPGWLLSRSCLWRSRKPFLFTSSVKDVWNCTTSLH